MTQIIVKKKKKDPVDSPPDHCIPSILRGTIYEIGLEGALLSYYILNKTQS